MGKGVPRTEICPACLTQPPCRMGWGLRVFLYLDFFQIITNPFSLDSTFRCLPYTQYTEPIMEYEREVIWRDCPYHLNIVWLVYLQGIAAGRFLLVMLRSGSAAATHSINHTRNRRLRGWLLGFITRTAQLLFDPRLWPRLAPPWFVLCLCCNLCLMSIILTL